MCIYCFRGNMLLNNNYKNLFSKTESENASCNPSTPVGLDSQNGPRTESPKDSVQRMRKIYLPSELEEEEDINPNPMENQVNPSPRFPLTSKHFYLHSGEFSSFKRMKRSFSFGGFGMFSYNGTLGELTPQEIESMLDPVVKKEPSKMSKKQIKEYAQKYKHLQDDKKKKTPWYRDPLEYTQPAHLITCIAFVYLAFRLFPDSRRNPSEASTLTRLLYVASVSAVFGAQFWMTFVSGLALFFSIPRHMFAKVQNVLFPLYFLTNAGLMLVAIVTYTQHHPTHMWDTHQLIQGGILVSGFIINLGIRLYLAPILGKLITIKLAIEAETGVGSEIGTNQPGVLSRCPHYMRLYKAFRRLHAIIAIGNMTSMAGTSFHLYYLATKLCS